jgi:hypothetical protein
MFAAGRLPAPELEAPVRAQIRAVKDALAPWAAKQMYLNLAETQQDAATFWTEQAYHRLRRIKTAVDPDDLIRSNHPVPPASPRPRDAASRGLLLVERRYVHRESLGLFTPMPLACRCEARTARGLVTSD